MGLQNIRLVSQDLLVLWLENQLIDCLFLLRFCAVMLVVAMKSMKTCQIGNFLPWCFYFPKNPSSPNPRYWIVTPRAIYKDKNRMNKLSGSHYECILFKRNMSINKIWKSYKETQLFKENKWAKLNIHETFHITFMKLLYIFDLEYASPGNGERIGIHPCPLVCFENYSFTYKSMIFVPELITNTPFYCKNF